MAERELDAGKPLFKKRTRIGRHAHRVTAYESLQSEEGSPQDKSVSLVCIARIDIRFQFVKANVARQENDAPSAPSQPSNSLNSHLKPTATPGPNNLHNDALLTSVPEVDLGVQPRLDNIEATEKAKRALMQRTIPNPLPESEPGTLDEARRKAQYGPPTSHAPRRERPSDDRVYKRFRQRTQR